MRDENTSEINFSSTGYRTQNHQVMSQTRSPLCHQGGAAHLKGPFRLKIHAIVRQHRFYGFYGSIIMWWFTRYNESRRSIWPFFETSVGIGGVFATMWNFPPTLLSNSSENNNFPLINSSCSHFLWQWGPIHWKVIGTLKCQKFITLFILVWSMI